MEILDDKICEFSAQLCSATEFDKAYSKKLDINSTFLIIATHAEIENNEWVYNIVLYDNEKNEAVDSIYSEVNAEQIEDIIYFFLEEYKVQ